MTPVVSDMIKQFEAKLLEEPGAIDEIIEELKQAGTPIIEAVEGYNRFVWVTHFYYANEGVKNVAVYESHIPFNFERALLEPIANTQLYAKTTIVPYNQQLYYGFSIDDSLDPNCSERMQKLIPDPLNPFVDEDVDGVRLSVVQTPSKEV